MSQFDAIICRLRAARWRALEAQATYDCLDAAKRRDKAGRAAAELWAEICALRVEDWEKEAERV